MFRRILASILSVVFIIYFIPAILFLSLLQTYLDPSFYYTKFLDQSYGIVFPYIEGAIKENNSDLFKKFTDEEIKKIISDVFTKELFKEMLISFVYELKTIDDKNNIKISLIPLQDKTEDITGEIAILYLEKIPVCEENISIEEINIFECRPSDLDTKKTSILLTQEISKNFLNLIPEEIEIEQSKNNTVFDMLKYFENYTDFAHKIIVASLILFPLIIGIIIFKPIKRVFRHISVDLLIGSSIVILIAIFMKNLYFYFNISEMLPKAAENFEHYLYALSLYSKQIFTNTLIIFIFAVILLLLTFIFKSKKQLEKSINEDTQK